MWDFNSAYVGLGSGASNWCRSCNISALPPRADVGADIVEPPVSARTRHMQRSKDRRYSITSAASESKLSEILTPSSFAVLRLITSSNLVGCRTGRSPRNPCCSKRPARSSPNRTPWRSCRWCR